MSRSLIAALSAAVLVGLGMLAPTPAIASCAEFPDAPSQAVVAVGEPADFSLPGLCFSGTVSTPYNPDSMTLSGTYDGSADAGFTLTPPADYVGVGVVGVSIDFGGDAPTYYTLNAFFGVSPYVVWPPDAVPNPIGIEPGGTAQFTLPGLYWPRHSECEITITVEPDVDIAATPPNLVGAPIDLRVIDETFEGIITVNYGLACTPPGGARSGVNYAIDLYVGVPLPTPTPTVTPPPPSLAATGTQLEVPLLEGAVVLALLGVMVVSMSVSMSVSGRRRRERPSR